MGTEPQALSLCELSTLVKNGIRDLFPDSCWIIAEISELNINQSGHCYLELVEKKPDSEQILARSRATIWAFTFRMLRPYFESVTRQFFAPGIKIMAQVSVEFHEVYGFSLNIKDIEPNFTLGDVSRKRQEIIQRLQDEGVLHLNKELDLPAVPQRIAVISSESAAGYGDFVDQLKNNQYGYSFHIKLFQSYMQGDEVEKSVVNALEQIYQQIDQFDLVVIIRGGGSQLDLNCFNAYWLCYHITQFPIPVLTGIGHERDETIADLVAHTSLKTPTAVAEFIIDQVVEFDSYLDDLHGRIINLASEQLLALKEDLANYSRNVTAIAKLRIHSENQQILTKGVLVQRSVKSYFQKNIQLMNILRTRTKTHLRFVLQHDIQRLDNLQKNAKTLTKNLLINEQKRLSKLDNAMELLNPLKILKRGYTITYHNGKIVKSIEHLKTGDTIENKWIDGKSMSTVKDITPTP
jgi:exodeoxyribonuclease VII large subunit